MKKHTRFIAVLIALCLAATFAPTVGRAADSSYIDLEARIAAAQDGATITLEGDAAVQNNTAPWIIKKNITIDGGGHIVTVRSTGVLLGANVTFKNMRLDLTSTDSRNAIIANGYELTLNNVKAGQRSINLFGGTLHKASHEESIFEVPTPGTANRINILGKTNLQSPNVNTDTLGPANIFAGSLAMGGLNPQHNTAADDGIENTYVGDVTINIGDRENSTALGTVYAGGGQQRIPIGWTYTKETTPNPDKYKVDGTVTVTGAAIPDVDGLGATVTNVVYSGDDFETKRTFTNISALSVESGNLVLANDSSFRNDGSAAVSVDARLNLSEFSDRIQNFNGEDGILVLGQNQTLTIDGNVSGTAKVAVGSVAYGNANSSAVPMNGHTYITAPNSAANSFVLLPNLAQPDMKFVRDGSGNWKASNEEGAVSKLIGFAPTDTRVSSGAEDVTIPLNTEYSGTPFGMETIQLAVRVNDKTATFVEDDYLGDHYAADTLYLYFGDYGDGDKIAVYAAKDSFETPPDGTYRIEITVPGEHTASGTAITKSVTLTVGSGSTGDGGSTGDSGSTGDGGSTGGGSTGDGGNTGGGDSTGGNTGGGNLGGGGSSGDLDAGDSAETVEDGSVTNPDGSVTVTTTDEDSGRTTAITTYTDGSTETVIKQSDGFAATIKTDKDSARAEVQLSAQEKGSTVTLPIPPLPGNNATITVRTGSESPIRVEIPAEGSPETTVAYIVGEDGAESIVKTAVLADGKIGVVVADGATIHLRDNSKEFDDTVGHWAEKEIAFITAREIFLGTAADTFSPEAAMTRRMMMMVLARIDGVEAAGASEGLEWAVSRGISDGQNPEETVSREQLVTMLYRYAGSPKVEERELSFGDAASVSGYARDAMRWAVDNGIINGFEDETLRPGGLATRAQVTAMLARYVRYLDLSER